jgi:CRISPR system Cascade subunit CasB
MTTQSDPRTRWGQIARHWWSEVQDTNEAGSPNRARDPAALARLRRAAAPVDALEEPTVFDLYRRFGFGRRDIDYWLTRVAVVAVVLAHIRSDASPSDNGYRRGFAEMLGGENPIMSPLRFRRLLAATEDRDLLIGFRRAVGLAGAKNINVGDVAASLLDWSDRRRMRWAFDYYGAGSAAPKLSDTTSDDGED